MKRSMLTLLRGDATQGAMRRMKILLAAPVVLSSAGCVQVATPDKPIEINLNINIRQEVVVRLQQDVRDLIKENPGVF
jgi:YnbE-like lipoprotein